MADNSDMEDYPLIYGNNRAGVFLIEVLNSLEPAVFPAQNEIPEISISIPLVGLRGATTTGVVSNDLVSIPVGFEFSPDNLKSWARIDRWPFRASAKIKKLRWTITRLDGDPINAGQRYYLREALPDLELFFR